MPIHSFITYMLFSSLDVVAVNMLILKLYRQPLRRYKVELLSLSIVLAVFSYIVRVRMNVPAWDPLLHYIIYMLFYWRVLKYRLHYAAFMIGSGLSAYLTIQIGIYYVMRFIGVVDESVIFAHTGLAVTLIQLCSDSIGVSLALLLKFTGRGFSFISVPPQDTYAIQYTEDGNLLVVASGFISAITVSLTLLIGLLSQNYFLMLLLSVVTFAIASYFSYRSDYESLKDVIQKYRKKMEKKTLMVTSRNDELGMGLQ